MEDGIAGSVAIMRMLALILSLVGSAAMAQGIIEPGAKVAFLGITFIDTSTEGDINGPRDDEARRMDMVERLVADRFAAETFDLVDTAPVASTLDATVNPADCYGCELRMAKQLGADYVLVGEIQKVSNLILSMNLVLRDVESGTMVRGMSADIRSNTDDSWARGMNYIMKNNIFREGS